MFFLRCKLGRRSTSELIVGVDQNSISSIHFLNEVSIYSRGVFSIFPFSLHVQRKITVRSFLSFVSSFGVTNLIFLFYFQLVICYSRCSVSAPISALFSVHPPFLPFLHSLPPKQRFGPPRQRSFSNNPQFPM